MAPHKTISYVSTLLLLITLAFTSCSKDSDLFEDTIQEQIEEELDNNGELIPSISFETKDDEFTISGEAEFAILDVLKNDSIPVNDLESYQIVAVTDALEGDLKINDDNTITYTPYPESASKAGNNGRVTDQFTYTLEVRGKGNQGKKEKEATVVVNTEYGSTDMGALKAFPGAKGFGQNTTGGRGGRVIHVTNLNDSGPGSLRAAVETEGPRIVVFDVGGDIFLEKNLMLRVAYGKGSGDLTIAGETAPFPGITLRNKGIQISESNVIIRYLTIRLNETRDNVNTWDCLRIRNFEHPLIENFIFDHVTFSHGDDEIINFNGGGDNLNQITQNITVQNCMIGESNHTYNTLIGPSVFNLTFTENYFHNTADRNVLYGYGWRKENAEQINNVVYGYNYGTTVSWGSVVDIIANVYKRGYVSDAKYAIGYGLNTHNNPNASESDGALYTEENFLIDGDKLMDSGATSYSKAYRVVSNSLINSWENNPSSIISNVLDDCGNSLFRDEMDEGDVADFYNGTGNWGTENIPNKSSNSRPDNYDTDLDGMADAWEIRTYGSLDKDASGDANGDGYTNIEEFFFSLVQ